MTLCLDPSKGEELFQSTGSGIDCGERSSEKGQERSDCAQQSTNLSTSQKATSRSHSSSVLIQSPSSPSIPMVQCGNKETKTRGAGLALIKLIDLRHIPDSQ